VPDCLSTDHHQALPAALALHPELASSRLTSLRQIVRLQRRAAISARPPLRAAPGDRRPPLTPDNPDANDVSLDERQLRGRARAAGSACGDRREASGHSIATFATATAGLGMASRSRRTLRAPAKSVLGPKGVFTESGWPNDPRPWRDAGLGDHVHPHVSPTYAHKMLASGMNRTI